MRGRYMVGLRKLSGFCPLLQVACTQPGSGLSSCSGEVAVPGACKPLDGEGTESRRLPPLHLLQ